MGREVRGGQISRISCVITSQPGSRPAENHPFPPTIMRSDGHDFARLTNLADGIFAVSMTFLAFTIQVPPPGPGPDGSLVPRLGAMLPQFGILALSFAVACRI